MQLTHFKVPPVNHKGHGGGFEGGRLKPLADKRRSYFFFLPSDLVSPAKPLFAARQVKISFTANQQKLITTCSGKLAAGNCTAKCNLDESRGISRRRKSTQVARFRAIFFFFWFFCDSETA